MKCAQGAQPCVGDQVIREDPSAAGKRCRGTEKSAEDLVGPPEWMESERRYRSGTPIAFMCAKRFMWYQAGLLEKQAWPVVNGSYLRYEAKAATSHLRMRPARWKTRHTHTMANEKCVVLAHINLLSASV